MPTARVMFYQANRIAYSANAKFSDDDFFMHLLNTQEAKDYCYKKYPWAYNLKDPEKSIPPNEVHGMYAWLDVKVTGKRMSDFVTNLSWDDIVQSIQNRKAIMTSGTFGNILGHAFVFVGYKEDTKELLIADPYGDYKTSYKNPRGYNITMNYEDFCTHTKPAGEFLKWGHIVL